MEILDIDQINKYKSVKKSTGVSFAFAFSISLIAESNRNAKNKLKLNKRTPIKTSS